MKKYLSVFEMITRSTLYKVILMLVLMVMAQLSMYGVKLHDALGQIDEHTSIGLEQIVDESGLVVPLAIGFVLITVILCWCGCNIGSNQGYTLRRLQIGERAVFVLQILYNCLAYVLLWASQVAVTIGISILYAQYAPDLTNQSIVLAYYKNPYMHSVLPMEDAFSWMMIVFMILSCGIASAAFPIHQRRRKVGYSILVAATLTMVFFLRNMDANSELAITSSIFLVIAFVAFFGVFMGLKEESEDE